MNLSNNLSSILHTKTDSLMHIPQDTELYYDIKNHLYKNPDYKKERREYINSHNNIIFAEREYYFHRDYIRTFHLDVERFVRNHAEMNAGEATEAFCTKFRGYLLTYGVELIRRAVMRCV